MKYPQNEHASLGSARFSLSVPPNLKSAPGWGRSRDRMVVGITTT